ncbi:MAG: Gfo/Idh/MocA family oxidoreductase, partial [Planctomycetes bacterium]|nr:Gfo/Idh/MocA family oxidoreductase [Planctomycetota bacterium]
MSVNRRNFLKGSLLSGMAVMAPNILYAKSGKTFRTALIGSGWWGTNIAREAIQSEQCQIVACCDVDEHQLNASARLLGQLGQNKPNTYKDFRDLLDKEKPDIAIVATPDHWHPLITIAAIQAGADVYVEKPLGHTIYEGRAMLKAARLADRVVQVGTHRRVSPHNISGMQFLKEGHAGKIGMVRSFVHYPGGPGKPIPDSQPPETLDWDMWCGPAPLRPYNSQLHSKGFRHYLDYANGQLGDWGIHWLDHILWWTDELYPKTVSSTGGRYIKRDSTDAPDTQVVTYEFETFTATWEHRMYAGNNAEKHNVGCYFYGTEGTFHMGWRDGWTFYPSGRGKSPIHQDPTLHQPDDQNIKELWADFMSAVKTRKRPVSDIEIGPRSTNMSL